MTVAIASYFNFNVRLLHHDLANIFLFYAYFLYKYTMYIYVQTYNAYVNSMNYEYYIRRSVVPYTRMC